MDNFEGDVSGSSRSDLIFNAPDRDEKSRKDRNVRINVDRDLTRRKSGDRLIFRS